jgi:hypothetical protein
MEEARPADSPERVPRPRQLRPVPKPLALRVQDLLTSLRVVRDLVSAVRSGATYHMAPIYGQLRAMLTDKGSGNTALLQAVAAELDYPLMLFAVPGVDDAGLPEIPEGHPAVHVSMGEPSIHRTLPRQAETTLAAYLEQKVIRWGEHTFSVRDAIEDLANTAGGAHWGRNLKQQVGWFQSLALGHQLVVANGILQVAELALALGTDLSRKASGFELLIDLALVDAPIDRDAVIFDAAYPGSPIRTTLALQRDRRLRASAVGLDGSTIIGLSEDALGLPGRHQLGVFLDIEVDLSTRLRVMADGTSESVTVLGAPVFVVVNRDCNVYWNRSAEREDVGMHFCCVEAMQGGGSSPLERARLLVYMTSAEVRSAKERGVDFTPETWAVASAGTSDLSFNREARQVDLVDLP